GSADGGGPDGRGGGDTPGLSPGTRWGGPVGSGPEGRSFLAGGGRRAGRAPHPASARQRGGEVAGDLHGQPHQFPANLSQGVGTGKLSAGAIWPEASPQHLTASSLMSQPHGFSWIDERLL